MDPLDKLSIRLTTTDKNLLTKDLGLYSLGLHSSKDPGLGGQGLHLEG